VNTFSLRPATLDDVPEIVETVQQGFATYAEFAPRGWTPPEEPIERAGIVDRLPQADVWCVMAFDGDTAAGHVAFHQARGSAPARELIPDLAHLWMLFIREPWWGSGLAPHLHDMAIEEAAARGYPAMRLYTPHGQARARAFYERRGWELEAGPNFEPMLGLDLVEYRRAL
jgi:ribosomal protein S18 acetylase RimI-like enzyme